MLRFRRLVAPFSIVLLLLVAGPTGTPAFAQETGEDEKTEEDAEAEPAAVPSTGPFIDAMSRLSTVLGSMHFLRELCGNENTAIWREQMNAFLAAQSPNEADRKRLIASFNSGYRSFQSTYRHCTPAARLAHNRYQQEGAALSRDMLTRYGN